MAYSVTQVQPVPPTDLGVQQAIQAATANGEHLVCIEIDAARDRLLIVTED